MSTATYLYCLVRHPGELSLQPAPPGLPGLGELRALDLGDGLWLVAATAPLPEFSSERIEERESIRRNVRERVLKDRSVTHQTVAHGNRTHIGMIKRAQNGQQASQGFGLLLNLRPDLPEG